MARKTKRRVGAGKRASCHYSVGDNKGWGYGSTKRIVTKREAVAVAKKAAKAQPGRRIFVVQTCSIFRTRKTPYRLQHQHWECTPKGCKKVRFPKRTLGPTGLPW
jgi:hypothetical protein